MQFSFKRVATLFMAVLLVGSLVTGAFAGSVAAETTTLAGDGTDAVDGFNASSDDHLETSVSADGTDFSTDGTETLYMNVTYNGHEYAELSATVDDGTASSQTLNMSHSALEKLPGDAGENTTINVTTWGVNSSGDVTTAENEFEVDLEFADTHAVRTIHSENDSIVSDFESADDEDDGWFSSLSGLNPFASTADTTATIEDDVGINGSQTDLMVYSEDSDVTEAFDSQLEDAEDGERVGMLMSSQVGDGIVYVFANEPGETITGDEVDEDDTYIVANEGGAYEVNFGEEYDGENTASVSLTAGEKFDRADLREDLDYSWAQSLGLNFGSLADMVPGIGMIGGDALALGVLAPIGLKRRQMEA